jgi:hypothetical protein
MIMTIKHDSKEKAKNHELMLKFLEETKYIEETAMENDPCFLCNSACEECKLYENKIKKTTKKKNRYDLLKEKNS